MKHIVCISVVLIQNASFGYRSYSLNKIAYGIFTDGFAEAIPCVVCEFHIFAESKRPTLSIIDCS